MTALPTADQQAAILATDALDSEGLTLEAGFDVVSAILAVVIPHIRADERQRCIEAVRAILPPPQTTLYSVGYRAGHEAALDEAVIALDQLPIAATLD